MDIRKFILQKTAVVASGQALCATAMTSIFALLGHFDSAVLIGSIAGSVLAVLNFLLMAISASLAADRAQAQNVRGGQATMQTSYLVRMVVLFIVLLALGKSGLCNPIAAVLPLTFTRPVLTISEFFRKAGENNL